MTTVAERWRQLSEEDREIFNRKAEQDKVRHQGEQAVWAEHLKEYP